MDTNRSESVVAATGSHQSRRRAWWGGLAVTALAVVIGSGLPAGRTPAAVAQEGPSPSDMRRMYDEVVNQLRNAQDRKNELASENDKLTKRLADAERRLKQLEGRNAELERDASDFAFKTYQHRATSAAMRDFVSRNPDVRDRWERFLRNDAGADSPAAWFDRAWPFRGEATAAARF